jgi:rhodanese-related sulfurtransferase
VHNSIATLLGGLLLLGASTLVSGANEVMCLAAGHGEDTEISPSPFSARQTAFNNIAEYRQWHKRCRVSADDFKRSAGAYLLIDTRAATEFAQGHVAQSMNIPLASLKTRRFLRNKSFLMLDAGHERVALLQACKQLHAAGYASAKVLDGGLLTLTDHVGRRLDAAVVEQLQTIPPTSLLYDKGYESWIVFNLASTVSPKLESAFSDIYSFETLPQGDVVSQILASRRTGSGGAGSSESIVVVDESGQQYRNFKQWSDQYVDSDLHSRLFYLRGGAVAFDQFVKTHYAMLSKQHFVLNRPRGCAQ